MPVANRTRQAISASTSPVTMEISHAGKKEPRMLTEGESAQPAAESAPRDTSRSRNALPSPSRLLEPIPCPLSVTRPCGL